MSPTFLMFRSIRDISVVPGGSSIFPSAFRQSSMSSKPSLRTTFSSLGAAATGAEIAEIAEIYVSQRLTRTLSAERRFRQK
ncbi:Uncharacterised protein [Mycobacteroides abscessus subsp. abscessus]|nr:Uncharacterised protein [Mycobacteroides abscessus subsp. abscessus]